MSPSSERRFMAESGSSRSVLRGAVRVERQHRIRCLSKYDGFRRVVRKVGGRVGTALPQRQIHTSLNRSLPDVAAAIERLPFVWDAELTVDEPTGQSSFERLQLRARTSMANGMHVRAAAKLHPARLYIFDLLAAQE